LGHNLHVEDVVGEVPVLVETGIGWELFDNVG